MLVWIPNLLYHIWQAQYLSKVKGVPMLMDVKILLDKAEQHPGHALEVNKGAYWVGWAEVIILMLVIIRLNTG